MHFFQRLFLPCGKFVHFSRADGKNFDMMGMAVEKNSKHMRRYRLLQGPLATKTKYNYTTTTNPLHHSYFQFTTLDSGYRAANVASTHQVIAAKILG